MNPELQNDTSWVFSAVGIVTAILSPVAWVFKRLFGRIKEAEALARALDERLTEKIDANAEAGRKDRDALRGEIAGHLAEIRGSMATRTDIQTLNTTMELMVRALSARSA